MRFGATGITMIVAGAAMLSSTSLARAQSCDELWYERNAIYKEAGYCFKTRRAISTFGNDGCQYDNERDVPLTRAQRARIAWIIRQERDNGCR